MKKNLIACLLLGSLINLYGQRPSGPPNTGNAPKIKITGIVLDKETQEPLEYATLSLVNENFPDRIQGGITDVNGKFDLEIFPGKYNVTIEYIGFDKNYTARSNNNEFRKFWKVRIGYRRRVFKRSRTCRRTDGGRNSTR